MIVLMLRSPSVNTLSTISCSTGETSPSSVPSWIMDLISSSVTLLSPSLIPRIRVTPKVLLERKVTSGLTRMEKNLMAPETFFATVSELLSAIRFGTSSPKRIVKYMTIRTMIVLDRKPASMVGSPQPIMRLAKPTAILFPEKIPVRIPIRVMPIWTADKNFSGSSASLRAVFAALLPASASACSFDFRAETKAISDMEKIPFRRIRQSMTSASHMTISKQR